MGARCRTNRDAYSHLTPQFSGGALPYVPWQFIHDRPLQLLVRRLSDTLRMFVAIVDQ
jgi:hypothetical protein